MGSIQELKAYNDWHILNHRLIVFLFTSFLLFSVHATAQFYEWEFSSRWWFSPNWNSTLKGLISCGLLLDGHTMHSRNIFIKSGSVLQVFIIPFMVNSKGEKGNLNTKVMDNYSIQHLYFQLISIVDLNSTLYLNFSKQTIRSKPVTFVAVNSWGIGGKLTWFICLE